MRADIREFYTQPSAMTSPGEHAALFRALPDDPAALAAVLRPPQTRLPGNCRHFTVLMTALLRAHGTAARARCGFGGYYGNVSSNSRTDSTTASTNIGGFPFYADFHADRRRCPLCGLRPERD
jgi:Transglutaminase-like superfamily